ncbi:hypothetical protein AAEX28_13355 [Lentisphaerota bacterium WC36G]|nr:hypothetical protein LJT99_00115 [Lentisphaerae bacterium WC36]
MSKTTKNNKANKNTQIDFDHMIRCMDTLIANFNCSKEQLDLAGCFAEDFHVQEIKSLIEKEIDEIEKLKRTCIVEVAKHIEEVA